MIAGVLIATATAGAAAVAVQFKIRADRLLDVASGGHGWVLSGRVLDRYLDEGGPGGALGLPVGHERPATLGPSTPLGADREATFEHGTIYLDSAESRTKVVPFDLDDA